MAPLAETPRASTRAGRSVGIDVAKGLAVLAVIAQHTVDATLQNHLFRPVWLDQAVPVFIVLFAYNQAGSLTRSGARTLRQLYTWDWLTSRVRRLLLPAVVAMVVLIVGGILVGRFVFNNLVVIGAAPIVGGAPGDYFIALIISLAALFPLVWWCWLRAPRTTLAGLVVLAAVQELFVGAFFPDTALGQYLAVANPVRMGAAVAAGLWLADSGALTRERVPHARALAWLAVPSLAYLVVLTFAVRADDFDGFGGLLYPSFNLSTGVWAAGWSLAFTVLLVRGFDRAWAAARGLGASALRLLAIFGQASFHLFLAQEVVLGLARPGETGWRVVAVLGALAAGWAAWRLDGALPAPRVRTRQGAGAPV